MNKGKDKGFYYKAISAFLIFSGLLTVYLYHMISQTGMRAVDYPFSYLLFQGQFFSFFTFQSNFIIAVGFLIATIYHNKKHRLIDNPKVSLAVTAYISVTCFVYIAFLLPGLFIKGNIRIEELLSGPFFHMLTPGLMIFYSLTHVKAMNISAKQYYKKNFFLYGIYPGAYTIYLIMRFLIYTNVPSLQNVPLEIVYPYLAIFNSTNWQEALGATLAAGFLMISFFVVVHVLFVIFNVIYFFSFRKLASKK